MNIFNLILGMFIAMDYLAYELNLGNSLQSTNIKSSLVLFAFNTEAGIEIK